MTAICLSIYLLKHTEIVIRELNILTGKWHDISVENAWVWYDNRMLPTIVIGILPVINLIYSAAIIVLYVSLTTVNLEEEEKKHTYIIYGRFKS